MRECVRVLSSSRTDTRRLEGIDWDLRRLEVNEEMHTFVLTYGRISRVGERTGLTAAESSYIIFVSTEILGHSPETAA